MQITATGHDDAAGLFAAGDSQGVFALWEVYDSVKGEGVMARLRQARALNAGESVDQDNEDEEYAERRAKGGSSKGRST